MLRRTVYLLCLCLLCAMRLRAATVCNAGYPGENSAQILHRLPQALIECPRPDVVVVFVGMNDAANEKRFQTPEQTRSNVASLLHEIVISGATPLLVTVHEPDMVRLMQRHVSSDYGDVTPLQRINALNQSLLSAASAEHVRIADFHAAFSRAGGATPRLSTDGVHLTPEGYRLLARTILQQLPRSAAKGKILCLGDSLTYGIGVRAAGTAEQGTPTYPEQLRGMLNGNL